MRLAFAPVATLVHRLHYKRLSWKGKEVNVGGFSAVSPAEMVHLLGGADTFDPMEAQPVLDRAEEGPEGGLGRIRPLRDRNTAPESP